MTKKYIAPDPKSIKNLHRLKWICYLCGLYGLVSALVILLSNILLDGNGLYLGIIVVPLFFFLYELMVILIAEKKKKTATARQLVNVYLGLKVGRILLSLVYVLIYYFTVGVHIKRFVMVFVVIYLIYLLFDTLYLSSGEKKTKES